MDKSWAEPGMKAWYKNLEKAAQKLVKKLGKSCAEAGIKAAQKLVNKLRKSWAKAAQLFPSFYTSFCAAFSQLLSCFFPASEQLYLREKSGQKPV